jgi:pyruvate/2-oxoglutarate/acetoin dehydrogenase E1 component
MPLTIRMPGGVARRLGAQHSQRLESMRMSVPGLRIVVPSIPQKPGIVQAARDLLGNPIGVSS